METLHAHAALGLVKKMVMVTLYLGVVVMVLVIAPLIGYGEHVAVAIQQYLVVVAIQQYLVVVVVTLELVDGMAHQTFELLEAEEQEQE